MYGSGRIVHGSGGKFLPAGDIEPTENLIKLQTDDLDRAQGRLQTGHKDVADDHDDHIPRPAAPSASMLTTIIMPAWEMAKAPRRRKLMVLDI